MFIAINSKAQNKKYYFIHFTSGTMENPSATIMSINVASEALKQGHFVLYFAAGVGVRILLKYVIKNLHTVTPYGGGFWKISQMAESLLLELSNNGSIIDISEGFFATYVIDQENHKEHLIQESLNADIVFSY